MSHEILSELGEVLMINKQKTKQKQNMLLLKMEKKCEI